MSWIDVGILFGAAFICLLVYTKWIYNYWKRLNVPSLNPSFPMGDFEPPWALKRGMLETTADIYNKFKSRGVRHGGMFLSLRPHYMPIDLDIVKNIMIKDFQYFVDRGLYHNDDQDPLSGHLLRKEGDKWRHLRLKLSPTFTSGKMKAMFNLVLGCARGLEREVEKSVKMNEPLDIKEIAALFTTNSIGTCAFGLECNCFENPKNDFRRYSKTFFDESWLNVIKLTLAQSYPNLCKKMGLCIFDKGTTTFFSRMLRSVLDQRKSMSTKRNDFIDLLLQVNEAAKTEEESFSLEEILAQAFGFFLAGFETSSSVMTFAIYEMAKNQAIQNELREEVNRVLEKYDGKLTYDAIMDMKYMQQVFDETLRKYPILPAIDRICTRDYKIPGEDLVLKKGTKIMISVKGIQHDPEYYPEPEKFDPDRFSPENKANRHPCAYIPFGEGPRICIGMRFGVMQSKIGIALLLKDHMYSVSSKMPEMKLSIKTSQLITPAGGVLLDVKKIR